MAKYVYAFNEGKKEMKNLLGGKGANLAEMTNIGMPVPMVLLLQQKHVQNTMKMVRLYLMK